MSKRNDVNLVALTAKAATPMPETERLAAPPAEARADKRPGKPLRHDEPVPTAEMVNLSFKVSPAFRDRFKDVAHNARMKQNVLLFAALDAWVKANPK